MSGQRNDKNRKNDNNQQGERRSSNIETASYNPADRQEDKRRIEEETSGGCRSGAAPRSRENKDRERREEQDR